MAYLYINCVYRQKGYIETACCRNTTERRLLVPDTALPKFAVLLGIFEMCSVLQSREERYEAQHLGALQVEVSRDLKNTMLLQKSTPASS